MILLVEDQAIIAMAERFQLENAGYRVVHVTNGEKAIAYVTEHPGSIDLILMDIDLGSGIDGTEAAERILAEIDIPIVFLSSHTEREYVEKTDRITSYGYVVKDSGEMVLLRSITMAFRLHAANRRLEQRNAEVAAAEHRYHQLFDNMTAGFALHEMIYDLNGRAVDYRFLDVNPAFERLTGLTAEIILGRTVREVLPDTEQYWIDAYAAVLETGEPLEYEDYSRELDRSFEVWAFRHDPGTFAVVINDTTERILTQRQLNERTVELHERAREQRFTYVSPSATRIVGYTPEEHYADPALALKIVHPDDRHLLERLAGWTQEEAHGRPIEEILNIVNAETRQPAPNPVAEVLSTGTIVGLANHTALAGETVHVVDEPGNGADEVRLFDTIKSPFRDPSGRVIGVLGISRDITEKARLQQDVKKAQQELERFFSIAPDLMCVLNTDGRFEVLSDSWQQALTEQIGGHSRPQKAEARGYRSSSPVMTNT